MTREEKEQTGKYVLQMARLLEDGCYQQEMLLKAVHIIDEALEQEPTTKNDLAVEKTDMIDKSNFSQEQYKSDLQSAYDCGYAQAKNDLGVDTISRADAIKAMQDKAKKLTNEDTINGLCGAVAILYNLPSVTPQEPQSFKWCTDCKEYDQEKHCCHRYSKVIRDTVAEIRQEPVLDKIRAEIENDWQLKKYPSSPFSCGLRRAIEIIDKHKTESEK